MSTTGPTWKDPYSERTAKLDFAILYDVSRETTFGTTDWIGDYRHDHARISMAIGQEIWGPPLPKNQAPEHRNRPKPKIRQKDLAPHIEQLNKDLAPSVQDITQRIETQQISAKEGKEEMCTNRIAAIDALFPKGGGEDRKGVRTPHRDPTQREAHREIQTLKRALAEPPCNPPTEATVTAMTLLNITEELQLTRQDIAHHARGDLWQAALQSRITWKERVIDEITCKQIGKIKHQERIRDRKRIDTEFKARRNMAIECTPAQTNILFHPAANGILWISTHTDLYPKPTSHSTNLKARWPQAIITESGTEYTAHLTIWATNMDAAATVLASLPLLTSHNPEDRQAGSLRSTQSFSWTQTHPLSVAHLKTLAASLSDTKPFQQGRIMYKGGILTSADLNTWTTQNTEQRTIHTLSILLPDLDEVPDLIDLTNTWDTSTLLDRSLLITTGPWEQTNKDIAWETFLEREGLPAHTCCPTPNCPNKNPVIIAQKLRTPHTRRKQWDDHPKATIAALKRNSTENENTTLGQPERLLKTFCHQCWDSTDFRHNVNYVGDMEFMHKAGIFQEKITNPEKRLRGKINKEAFQTCIETYLKTAVAPV